MLFFLFVAGSSLEVREHGKPAGDSICALQVLQNRTLSGAPVTLKKDSVPSNDLSFNPLEQFLPALAPELGQGDGAAFEGGGGSP